MASNKKFRWYSLNNLDFGGGSFGQWDDMVAAIEKLWALQADGSNAGAVVEAIYEESGRFGNFGFRFVGECVYPASA